MVYSMVTKEVLPVLYPMKFAPIYKQTVWGGRNISWFFGRDIPLDRVAESWELACREDGDSMVINGRLAGTRLSQLIREFPEKLLGPSFVRKNGVLFPLLIKYIDAHDNLSVQVHPGDDYAKFLGEPNGKNELWYVLNAEEHAQIIYGVKENITREAFTQALAENRIEPTLNRINVQAGDFYFVPAGKLHAILKGILIVEIQQNSNLTYRVYDWDRKNESGMGRQLHVSQALDVMDFQSGNLQPGLRPVYADHRFEIDSVLRSTAFNVDRVKIQEAFKGDTHGSFGVLICLQGSGAVLSHGESCPIAPGDTFLMPACIGNYQVIGQMTLLSAWITADT